MNLRLTLGLHVFRLLAAALHTIYNPLKNPDLLNLASFGDNWSFLQLTGNYLVDCLAVGYFKLTRFQFSEAQFHEEI